MSALRDMAGAIAAQHAADGWPVMPMTASDLFSAYARWCEAESPWARHLAEIRRFTARMDAMPLSLASDPRRSPAGASGRIGRLNARTLIALAASVPLVLDADERRLARRQNGFHRGFRAAGQGLRAAARRIADVMQGLQRVFAQKGDFADHGHQQPGEDQHIGPDIVIVGHSNLSVLSQVGDDAESAGPGNRPAGEAEAGQ